MNYKIIERENKNPMILGGVILSVIVIALLASAYFFSNSKIGGDGDEIAGYFKEKMISRGIERLGGQPIEGFDAEHLMRAFPSIIAGDFDGVQTIGGRYQVDGDTVSFVRDGSSPVSSAERTLSDKGFETLLANVSIRLKIPVEINEVSDVIEEIVEELALDGDVFFLGLNETMLFENHTLKVSEVLEDSRCPSDVACIQAGTVRVRVEVEEDGANPSLKEHSFILGEETEIYGKKIKFLSVEPARVSATKINPNEYDFSFEISRDWQVKKQPW